jgi:hypothetical protein
LLLLVFFHVLGFKYKQIFVLTLDPELVHLTNDVDYAHPSLAVFWGKSFEFEVTFFRAKGKNLLRGGVGEEGGGDITAIYYLRVFVPLLLFDQNLACVVDEL